jgi:predicted hydrocarbon binding protein
LKGIMFDLLEATVSATHGAHVWDDLLEETGLTGAYTTLGNYPDGELVALIGALAAHTGRSDREALRWFGRAAMPSLARAYPEFFAGHDDTRTFVGTLNDIIHPEVRKLYPGADVPSFGFHASDDGSITLRYGSPRRMCALAEGLIEGAAAQFDQVVTIEQPDCMLRGDELCTIEVRVDDRA